MGSFAKFISNLGNVSNIESKRQALVGISDEGYMAWKEIMTVTSVLYGINVSRYAHY